MNEQKYVVGNAISIKVQPFPEYHCSQCGVVKFPIRYNDTENVRCPDCKYVTECVTLNVSDVLNYASKMEKNNE